MKALLSSFFHPITYYSYAQGLVKLDGLAHIPISLKLHFLLLRTVALLSSFFHLITLSLQRFQVKSAYVMGLTLSEEKGARRQCLRLKEAHPDQFEIAFLVAQNGGVIVIVFPPHHIEPSAVLGKERVCDGADSS